MTSYMLTVLTSKWGPSIHSGLGPPSHAPLRNSRRRRSSQTGIFVLLLCKVRGFTNDYRTSQQDGFFYERCEKNCLSIYLVVLVA